MVSFPRTGVESVGWRTDRERVHPGIPHRTQEENPRDSVFDRKSPLTENWKTGMIWS